MPRFANPKSIASILVGWELEARLEVILMRMRRMMLSEKQTLHLKSVKVVCVYIACSRPTNPKLIDCAHTRELLYLV